VRPLIVDALASGRGKRLATRDVIGSGPRTVAGILERFGMEPRIATAEKVLREGFDHSSHDLLLVSGMTPDLRSVRRIVSNWRRHSDVPTLIGGPIASDPGILEKVSAHIAVTGEAEITLSELLDAGLSRGCFSGDENLGAVKGVSYRHDNTVHVNPLRPAMSREIFDKHTPSTRAVSDYPLHHAARVYVEVVRGCSNYHRARLESTSEICDGCEKCYTGKLEERFYCPQGIPPGCGYCSVPSLFGPPRSRSVAKIRGEIEDLLSRGVRRIVLSAPGFLDYARDLLVEPEPLTDPRAPEPNYEAIEKLLSQLSDLDLMKEGGASLMIENLKGELVTERAARLLGRYLVGTPVNVGFETGSLTHSRNIGRSSTPRENIAAVMRLKKAGLKPYVYFVNGLPGQNHDTVKSTVSSIRECVDAGASRIILYRFQPLPMSAFHDQPTGPPARTDELGKQIYEAARKANSLAKERLIGSRLKVVIAESYDRDGRYHVAYPMLHGPVVLVEGAEGLEGEVLAVEIIEVASERMVKGSLIQRNLHDRR